LPCLAKHFFRDSGGSTRLEQEKESLVAVIRDVLLDFGFDAADMATGFLCVGPRMLVSARPRPLRSLGRLRAAVKAGRTFDSPVDLLAHLLQEQANVLVEIVRKSTERVDAIEDALLASRISFSRGELSALRRMLVRLQRLLAPEPAALFRLLARPPGWVAEPQVQN
jgi:zinc transporter